MNNDPSDYEQIRARTERRLSPMLKLHRRRTRLAVQFVIFCSFLLLNGLLYLSLQDHSLAMAFLDEYRWYMIFMVIWPVWLLALIIIAINLGLAFRREGFIQREMSREIDLERLRLLREPSQADQFSEKPKRMVSLSDDGELIENDELPDEPLRRNMNHREG